MCFCDQCVVFSCLYGHITCYSSILIIYYSTVGASYSFRHRNITFDAFCPKSGPVYSHAFFLCVLFCVWSCCFLLSFICLFIMQLSLSLRGCPPYRCCNGNKPEALIAGQFICLCFFCVFFWCLVVAIFVLSHSHDGLLMTLCCFLVLFIFLVVTYINSIRIDFVVTAVCVCVLSLVFSF